MNYYSRIIFLLFAILIFSCQEETFESDLENGFELNQEEANSPSLKVISPNCPSPAGLNVTNYEYVSNGDYYEITFEWIEVDDAEGYKFEFGDPALANAITGLNPSTWISNTDSLDITILNDTSCMVTLYEDYLLYQDFAVSVGTVCPNNRSASIYSFNNHFNGGAIVDDINRTKDMWYPAGRLAACSHYRLYADRVYYSDNVNYIEIPGASENEAGYFLEEDIIDCLDTHGTSDANLQALVDCLESKTRYLGLNGNVCSYELDPCSKAIEFSGSNQQAKVFGNGDFNFGTNEFTIEMEIETSSTKNSMLLLSNNATGNIFALNGIYIGLENGKLYTKIHEDAFNYAFIKDYNGADLRDGERHQLAVTRTSNNIIKLYIDGEHILDHSIPSHYDVNHNSNYTLANTNLGSTSLDYEGIINELRVWDVERSGIEISNHYRVLADDDLSNLVGHWLFDQSTDGGQTFPDLTGNGHDAVLGHSASVEGADGTWIDYDCN